MKSARLCSQKAFSLIETLVAIAVIAFLMSFALRGLFLNKEKGVKTAFHRLIRLNSRLVDLSQSTGASYRLVLVLNEKGPDFYQVEKQNLSLLSQANTEDGSFDNDEKDIEKSAWRPARFFLQPKPLPSFLNIERVESPRWQEPVENGPAYIYYHPRGFAQETRIRITRQGLKKGWTLYLDPAQKSLRALKNAF